MVTFRALQLEVNDANEKKGHVFDVAFAFTSAGSRAPAPHNGSLEQVPDELIVDFVVILHFGSFDEGSEGARTAVGRD
ncbi:MAG: hypothetical protein ACHP8A_16470, partial [Terriglobales bacterium]